MRRFFATVLCLVLLTLRPAAAQPLKQDERVISGESPNGLRYVVVRHAMPPLRAQVWLNVDAGSLGETDQQRGAANFVARLWQAGSDNYPPESVRAFVQSLGEGAANTSFTDTVYRIGLRDATPDTVARTFAYLRDVASGLTFPAAAVEVERTAILADQKKTASVDQRVQEFLLAQLAPGSVVADRPRTGTPESVKAINVEDIRAFYKRWYVPSNMTLVFVGDMDANEVVTLINSSIGAGAKVARPARPEIPVSVATAPRAAVISDADLVDARLYILRPAPLSEPVRTVEELRRRVFDSLAVGAFNRRLGAKIQTGKLAVDNAGAFSSDFTGVCQLTGMYVASSAPAWRDSLKAFGVEVQRARIHGLHAGEVEDTKKEYLTQAEQNATTENLRPGAAYAQALTAAASNGDIQMSAKETLEHLKTIFATADQKSVSEHFAKLMDSSNALFMLAIPSLGDVPRESDVLAAGIEALSVTPAAEAEFIKPTALMTERPTPGKVVEEKMHDASGVWNGWLDNGILVHHKHMDVSKGQVAVTVAVTGGLIDEGELTRGLTEAGSVSWSRPATSKLPSYVIQELTQDSVQYRADQNDPQLLRLNGGPAVDNVLLVVSGPAEKMETGFQLFHLMLTDPIIESPALELWKKEQLAAADTRATQARSVFNDAMLDMVYPPSELRSRPLTRAQIERITLEAAQTWFRQKLAQGAIEVSIVGDIDRARAVELAAMYLGSLSKRERISSATNDSKRNIAHLTGPIAQKRNVEGMTPTAFIMGGFLGVDSDNINDARLMGVAAQILNARMDAGLRGTDQLVQNILVQSQTAQEFPGFGVFGSFAPTLPHNAEPAVKRIFEIYDEFKANGPTVEELAAAKQQVSIQMESALADPGFWSGQLSLLEYRGLKLDDLANALEPYKTITPDDVKNAFAKYDQPDKRMQLVLTQHVDPNKKTQIAPPVKATTPDSPPR